MRITLSYSWKNIKDANTIDNYFSSIGVQLYRDIRDFKYTYKTTKFAEDMRCCDYYICLISDAYLKSFNCMKEIVGFSDELYFEQDKFCPVVITKGKHRVSFSNESINGYFEYWQEQYDIAH